MSDPSVRGLDDVEVVVPTVGRPTLRALLASLAASNGPRPRAITVVDDRRTIEGPLADAHGLGWVADRVRFVRGTAAGPASARNVGWRLARASWISFLDDDVTVAPEWLDALARDLRDADPGTAGVQGRIVVPVPRGRKPTDWERNVAGLERAAWATADMAYRREVLQQLGGFDERFRHAYREDADLALRVLDCGHELTLGRRVVIHPVRPAGRAVSVRLQRGNADDVLMRALHGPDWRKRADAPPGRFRRHAAIVVGAAAAVTGSLARSRALALGGAALWSAGTAELAASRVRPGPRNPAEVATMVATSALLPFAAVAHRARGAVTLRRRLHDTLRAPQPRMAGPITSAVLFDRDGTLVVDVPYNGDPERVVLAPGAADALARLRNAGISLAVVSNQSGVARGLITMRQVEAVNARLDRVAGPFASFCYCPHDDSDGCTCRKPAPGLVREAARRLGVPPSRCVVIGDTGADVDAGRAAGARTILVPNERTRIEEIDDAPEVASDLAHAVDLALSPRAVGGVGRWRPAGRRGARASASAGGSAP
ncbi:MAG: HAD-IIIA family hydrolase [Actinobacteria bacterium]|nr:HAD-IIIA family hydrolase [Actinomycetota bacterium]